MNRKSPQARWLASAAIAVFAAACAQSNGDVNRVQPNVVRKSDLLDGEWYLRNTVTHTPFNTQFTFPGQTGAMEKLVWEIQEGNLVGYRSYPYMLGAERNIDPKSIPSGTTAKYCDRDGKCTGGQKYFGSPVVAFAIQSHFDIQRGYNPATGEQTNVISENSTDRIWNQREYIRVNWAANLLNTQSGMNWGTVQNPGVSAPVSSWVQPNEKSEDPQDWPTFEYEGEGDARKLKYFDVTGRYLAVPDSIFFEGYGNIPLCYFYEGSDCSSAEIKIRVSVAKIDAKKVRDYEPLLYGNDMMSLFGLFRTERLNWDKKFGAIESSRILIGNRHRLWNQSFEKDAQGEPDVTKPIPVEKRTVQPIVYYFTRADRMGGEDRYQEFIEPGKVIGRDYDRAFKRAVAAAQGKDPKDVSQVYFLCDNPVKVGNPKECGAQGFSPKFGDLRYSFMNTIAEPVANGLLGYGPSSADPETGEIISGNSNTYLWGVDMYGRNVLDWILLQNGEKDLTEYISGRDVSKFIKANPVYNQVSVNKQSGSIQAELQGIPQRNVETEGAFTRPSPALAKVLSQMKATGGLPKAGGDDLKIASELVAQNPQLEATLLDNTETADDVSNMLPAFAREKASKDPVFRRQMARLTITNLPAVYEFEKRRLDFLSKNNIYMAEFLDRSLVGVANELLIKRDKSAQEFESSGNARCATPTRCSAEDAKRFANDDIARYVRQQVWLSTSLHEMGHTINLRHNFQGSWDALNYPDAYWPLKEETITIAQGSQDVLPKTPNDLKAASDGTDSQRLNKIHSYEYASIMDYAGKIFTDWNGLGKYDEAAIIFAYTAVAEPGSTGAATTESSYVEVFGDTVGAPNAARRESRAFRTSDGNQLTISGAAVDVPLVNAVHTNPNIRNYTERYHYSLVPLHFGEGPANNIKAVIEDGIRKIGTRHLEKFGDVRKDEERVRAIIAGDPSLANDPDRANGLIGTVKLRVPYMFCTDESADGPVQSCYRFDRGADYYETTRNELEDYWNYYVDTHFRRDRPYFSANRAINSAYRTFSNVALSYRHYVLELYRQADRNQEQRLTYSIDPVLQDLWTMGVIDGINQNLNVMSVPTLGLYFYQTYPTLGARWSLLSDGTTRDTPFSGAPSDDFDPLSPEGVRKYKEYFARTFQDFAVMPRGLGRSMESKFDVRGGHGFQNRMSEVGHRNDQFGAMIAAVGSDIQLQGVDTDTDQNRFRIPYYLLFKNQLTDTFGALVSDDDAKVSPTAFKTFDDKGALTEDLGLFWRVYVKGSDLKEGFNYPRELPRLCTGTARPPSCFTVGQRAAPVNTQITFSSQIYALYFGMAGLRANFDLDYAKANQIYRLGGSEDFTVAAGYEKVEVPDVTTGARYAAVRPVCAPGTVCVETAATTLIAHSQAILSMVQNPARCPLPDYLAVQGYRCLEAEQANNAFIIEQVRRQWTENFRNSIRDLDLSRQYYNVLGRAF